MKRERLLTESQSAHALAFDERTVDPTTIDLEYYEKPQFGPWNPYWYVYDFLRRRSSRGGARLLSVGCGNGRDSIVYAGLGYQVDGIDISSRAIEIARRLAAAHDYSGRTAFSVQPAEELDFPSETFDVVCGVNVLHHVDIPGCIAEVHRVLKVGGCGIFKEPMQTPVRDKLRNAPPISWLVPQGTKNRLTGEKYELVLGEKNLDHNDLALMRRQFGNLSVRKWHVLAKLSALIGNRTRLERADALLFKILPFMRRFGDQLVIVVEKQRDG